LFVFSECSLSVLFFFEKDETLIGFKLDFVARWFKILLRSFYVDISFNDVTVNLESFDDLFFGHLFFEILKVKVSVVGSLFVFLFKRLFIQVLSANHIFPSSKYVLIGKVLENCLSMTRIIKASKCKIFITIFLLSSNHALNFTLKGSKFFF